MAAKEPGQAPLQPRWRQAAARIASSIDVLNEWVGRGIAWLVPLMVVTTFAVAVLRYGFGLGWVWLQETYVWAHGAIIMIGMGYTLLHDGHVRVDIFYQAARPRTRALINLLGVLLFLLPMAVVVLWVVYPYVSLSWVRLESSREAGGMPGLFVLKSTMLAFSAFLMLQGVSLALRSVLELTGGGDDGDAEPSRMTGYGQET